VDDVTVAPARQIEASREHVSRVVPAVPRIVVAVRPASIITIPVVGALAFVTVIVAVAPIVMLLDARRARSAPGRQRIIIVIALAFVPITRVAGISCVTVVTRIEVHKPSAGQTFAVLGNRI
jgi:hypothetical protein